MSIITGGLGENQKLITQGYGVTTIEVIVFFKGATQWMIENPIDNLNFKVNETTYTFTRQLRKELLEKEHLQGFCYACKIKEWGTVKITMPLFLTIQRANNRKPDMKFYFVQWHDIDSYDRERTIKLTSNMKPLVVEYQAKSRERRR